MRRRWSSVILRKRIPMNFCRMRLMLLWNIFAAHNPTKVKVEQCDILSENGDYTYVYIIYNLVLENDQEYPCVGTYMTEKKDGKYYVMSPSRSQMICGIRLRMTMPSLWLQILIRLIRKHTMYLSKRTRGMRRKLQISWMQSRREAAAGWLNLAVALFHIVIWYGTEKYFYRTGEFCIEERSLEMKRIIVMDFKKKGSFSTCCNTCLKSIKRRP